MNRDAVAIVSAVVVHAVLGVALAMTPKRPPAPPKIISVDVRKKVEVPVAPPPKVEPPKPPEPPKPEKQKVVRPPTPAKAPPPNQTPPPPKEPPKPVPIITGVTMDSTTEGDSSFTVPVGNTTMGDPNKNPKGVPVQPLPPAPAPAPEFVPASPLDVSSEPDPIDDPLSSMPYPDGEARDQRIEGESTLRIEIDEKGRVHGVKLVKSVKPGDPAAAKLDQLAVKTAYKFRFKPARDKRGNPVAYVISSWKVNWLLDR